MSPAERVLMTGQTCGLRAAPLTLKGCSRVLEQLSGLGLLRIRRVGISAQDVVSHTAMVGPDAAFVACFISGMRDASRRRSSASATSTLVTTCTASPGPQSESWATRDNAATSPRTIRVPSIISPATPNS